MPELLKKQTLENIHVEDIWGKKMKSAGWPERANKSWLG